MNLQRASQTRGYSLVELLVVVGMIGVLALVTIPNFINMRRASVFKSALRQFTNDVRGARQRAVTRSSLVRVSFAGGGREYYIWESTNEGTSWDSIGQNPRYMNESVSFQNGTGGSAFADTIDDGTLGDLPDIVFERTGIARVPSGLGKVLLNSSFSDLQKTQYTVSIRTTGMLSTE